MRLGYQPRRGGSRVRERCRRGRSTSTNGPARSTMARMSKRHVLASSFVVVTMLGCKEPTKTSNPPALPAASTSASAAALPTLKPGDDAPALSATASNGAKIDLASLKGKTVVVYFYPKDDTPGCTKEA